MNSSSRRRRFAALFTAIAMSATAVACTPRPDTGEDVLEDFFGALAAGTSRGGGLTDHAATARKDLDAAWNGLSAETLEAEIGEVRGDGGRTTAEVTLDWDLAGDREWLYDTTFHLTKSDSRWAVRWSPSALHPRLGNNQHPELRRIPAPRASVVGSDGASLLEPGTVHRVVLDRSAVPDVQGAVNRMATVVNNGMPTDDEGRQAATVDARAVGPRAAGGSGPFSVVVLPADAPAEVRDELASLPGVSVNYEAAMVRPDPGFAPELMSRVERVVPTTFRRRRLEHRRQPDGGVSRPRIPSRWFGRRSAPGEQVGPGRRAAAVDLRPRRRSCSWRSAHRRARCSRWRRPEGGREGRSGPDGPVPAGVNVQDRHRRGGHDHLDPTGVDRAVPGHHDAGPAWSPTTTGRASAIRRSTMRSRGRATPPSQTSRTAWSRELQSGRSSASA